MSGVADSLSARVSILQRVASDDGFGGQDVSWVMLATVFAEVVAVSSLSLTRSDAAQPKSTAGYRVRMRYRNDVDASMRLQWKDHLLNIYTLHEQDGMLELMTYEEQL